MRYKEREAKKCFPFELYIDFANNIFKSVRLCVLRMMFHVLLHIFPRNTQRCEVKKYLRSSIFPALAIAACAAGSLAIGTRKGEQDT